MRSKPNYAEAHNNLGVALLEQTKYSEAAAAFRDALQLDGSLSLARFNLAVAGFYAQDYDAAQRDAEAATTLMPGAAQPLYIRGLIARSQSHNDVARGLFEQVRQRQPLDVGTGINLAQIALEDQRYADAATVLQPLSEREPSNVTVAYVLGLALSRSGATAEGQRWLERAQTLRRSGYAVTYGTGYLEQGALAEALASTGREPDLLVPVSTRAKLSPVPLGPREQSEIRGGPGGAGRAGAPGTGDAAPGDSGLTLADIDGDGDLDVLLVSHGRLALWRKDAGTWVDATAASGLAGAADGVGVVAADIGLHLPDFRAAERTFQLLTQVAGRAGRDTAPGRVIVQTFVPDHYAIRPVRDSSWFSSGKRTNSTSRPSRFNTTHSSSACEIGHRRSSSLWRMSTGVRMSLA